MTTEAEKKREHRFACSVARLMRRIIHLQTSIEESWDDGCPIEWAKPSIEKVERLECALDVLQKLTTKEAMDEVFDYGADLDPKKEVDHPED